MHHKRSLRHVRRVDQRNGIPEQVLVGRAGDTCPHVMGTYVKMVSAQRGVPVGVVVHHMGHHLPCDVGCHLYARLEIRDRLPVGRATGWYKEVGCKLGVLWTVT